jgi:hypothetical protein
MTGLTNTDELYRIAVSALRRIKAETGSHVPAEEAASRASEIAVKTLIALNEPIVGWGRRGPVS